MHTTVQKFGASTIFVIKLFKSEFQINAVLFWIFYSKKKNVLDCTIFLNYISRNSVTVKL